MAAVATEPRFGLFPYLNEDLKLNILSYVADAPFESLPENYPRSSLTHHLPHVSKAFCRMADSDLYWKQAIERQVAREPFLWRQALEQRCHRPTTSTTDLIVGAAEGSSSYKALYQWIVSTHLRFKGAVFFMPGQVQLGEPYGLHFFEPRYRLLIAEVMQGQPPSAKHGGRIVGSPTFIHANRAPLAPTSPAVLVEVVRCELYPDGRADVLLLPTAHVWLERILVRPHSGHLYEAQCLRMGHVVHMEMNKLARNEALAQAMDRLAGELQEEQENDDEEWTSEEDEE